MLSTKIDLAIMAAATAGGWAHAAWNLAHGSGSCGDSNDETARPSTVTTPKPALKPKPVGDPPTIERFSFSEQITWRNPLRGVVQPTDREKTDALAISGLPNAAASVDRLNYTAEFGISQGKAIRDTLMENLACACVGATNDTLRSPPEAVAAIKQIIEQHVGRCIPSDTEPYTVQTTHTRLVVGSLAGSC